MTYVLLIIVPLAMASAAFLLRRDTSLSGAIGIAGIAVELWLALTAPIDQSTRLLNMIVNYGGLGQLFLISLCLGSLITALSVLIEPQGENFIPILLLVLGLAAATLIVQEPLIVAMLLLLASLSGGLQLIDQPPGSSTLLRPQTIMTALRYTLLLALGGVLLLIGFILATAFDQQRATTGGTLSQVVFGLLLIGFSVRAGLIPFHVWLPDVVEETSPATSFVQIGMLTILAVPVLIVALQTQPELFVGNDSGQRLLIGLGGLSAIAGGILALLADQRRRIVAMLAIANIGLITIGLGSGTIDGTRSALLGAMNHVIAIALLMFGLVLLERAVPGRREQAGALRERPFAALTFLTGALMLVGLPPLVGFVPRLLLIGAMREQGWSMELLVASGMIVQALAVARLLQRSLLRPRDISAARSLFSDDLDRLNIATVPYAPRTLLACMVVLVMALVVAGIWPQPIVTRIDEVVRGLGFLRQ